MATNRSKTTRTATGESKEKTQPVPVVEEKVVEQIDFSEIVSNGKAEEKESKSRFTAPVETETNEARGVKPENSYTAIVIAVNNKSYTITGKAIRKDGMYKGEEYSCEVLGVVNSDLKSAIESVKKKAKDI